MPVPRRHKLTPPGDVVLMASGGTVRWPPTLRVNVDGGAFSPAQPITTTVHSRLHLRPQSTAGEPHNRGQGWQYCDRTKPVLEL